MVGRIPAVLIVVTLVFAVLGLAGWGLGRQLDHLVDDLPGYRVNIRAKIADVRGAGKAARSRSCRRRSRRSRPTSTRPMRRRGEHRKRVVVDPDRGGLPGFTWLGPLLGPLGTAGLVVVLVVFMLLERRDLRDRLIGLIGYGDWRSRPRRSTRRASASAGSC